MGSHRVTCHPAEATFPPLSQPKLVLDLVTLEGCKAELIYSASEVTTLWRYTNLFIIIIIIIIIIIGTAADVRIQCPKLYIAVHVVINRTVRGEIRTWVFSHRNQTL